jgi:alpha-D-xyloside xylohydrolase
MTFRFLARAVAGLAVSVSGMALASEVQKIDQGVVVTPDSGPAKRVRVVAYGDDSFRVTAARASSR